jgi:tripartite ATP-independent transporter DctM subunit
MVTFLLLSFTVFLVLGVPIGFAMGLSGALALAFFGDISLVIIPQRIYSSLDNFSLLAVPLFVVAGELMSTGGITAKIVQFSRSVVGHIKGGLAQANVVSNMFMAALSGSAVADLVAIGSVMIPAMTKEGYRKDYTVAVTSCAALLGPIIPPSIVAVIYGSLTGVSIGALFVAGVIPGLIAGSGLMVLAYLLADRGGATRLPRASLRKIGQDGLAATPALMVPLIIMGGILGGVFTPTEAGAVAALYAFIYGLVRRRHTAGGLYALLLASAITTASALITLGGAAIFSYVLVNAGFAQFVLKSLLAITDNASVAMLLLMVGLFILGLPIEPIPALIMVVPIVAPVLAHYGINEIQFGMAAIMMLVLGSLTPPIGVLAMIACRMAKLEYGKSILMMTPFMLWWLSVTMLVAFVPAISLWLPSLVIP